MHDLYWVVFCLSVMLNSYAIVQSTANLRRLRRMQERWEAERKHRW